MHTFHVCFQIVMHPVRPVLARVIQVVHHVKMENTSVKEAVVVNVAFLG